MGENGLRKGLPPCPASEFGSFFGWQPPPSHSGIISPFPNRLPSGTELFAVFAFKTDQKRSKNSFETHRRPRVSCFGALNLVVFVAPWHPGGKFASAAGVYRVDEKRAQKGDYVGRDHQNPPLFPLVSVWSTKPRGRDPRPAEPYYVPQLFVWSTKSPGRALRSAGSQCELHLRSWSTKPKGRAPRSVGTQLRTEALRFVEEIAGSRLQVCRGSTKNCIFECG